MEVWRRESWTAIYQEGGRGGDQIIRRLVQDITEVLQMSASDAVHLTYYRVVFRMVVKETKFQQGQVTEWVNIVTSESDGKTSKKCR
jgi:hypothetical protein